MMRAPGMFGELFATHRFASTVRGIGWLVAAVLVYVDYTIYENASGVIPNRLPLLPGPSSRDQKIQGGRGSPPCTGAGTLYRTTYRP